MSYARSAVTRMTLDMSRPDLQRSETVTQGDTNRRWEVTLINGGAPFRLPPNWTAALTGIKPDGNGLQNGCSVVDGKIIYDFAAGKEIATCVGCYPVHFDIWDEVGELVASPKVYVNVLDDARPHAELESDGQYTQIGALIGRVNQTDAEVDHLAEEMQTQGDDITALKEKITTAGTITIPVSQWDALMPTKAYVSIQGGEALTRGGLLLVMPGDAATKDECERARVRIDIDLITDQQPPSVDQIVFIRAEERPDIPLNFKYFVLKTESQQGAVVALIGVDAYGEGGSTASGVDETAVRAIITAMLGNVDNVQQYSAKNPPPYPVTKVNGQTGDVNLPIPSEASDVKADPAGTAESMTAALRQEVNGKLADYDKSTAVNKKIGDHNVSTASHADIRLDLQRFADRLNAALNSDDTSLDDLKEIVAYIKANKTLIDGITSSKVNVADIVNNLTTNTANVPLSAAQGVVLKLLIDSLEDVVEGKVTADQVAAQIKAALAGYVPKEDGKGLSTNDYTDSDKAAVTKAASDSSAAVNTANQAKQSADTAKATALEIKAMAENGELDGKDGKSPTVTVISEGEATLIKVVGTDGVVQTATIHTPSPQIIMQKADSMEWLEEHGDENLVYILPDDKKYGYFVTEQVGEDVTNTIVPKDNCQEGKKLSGSGGTISTLSSSSVTDHIQVKIGDVITVKGWKGVSGTQSYVIFYSDDAYTSAARISSLLIDTDNDLSVSTMASSNKWMQTKTTEEFSFVVDYNALYVGTGITNNTPASEDAFNAVQYIAISGGLWDDGDEITVTTPGGGIEVVGGWQAFGSAIPTERSADIDYLLAKSREHDVRIASIEEKLASGNLGDEETTYNEALERIKTWDKPVYDDAPVTLLGDDRVKDALTSADFTIEAIYARYRALRDDPDHPENALYITETSLGPSTTSDLVPDFTGKDILRFDFCEPDGLTEVDDPSTPKVPDPARETKPKIIFISGIHKEWAGVYGLYYALEEIATNPDFDDIRRNAHIIVIPCANPFGMIATADKAVNGWAIPSGWASHVNANGIAPHNNFGVNFKVQGEIGTYNYGGTEAYSELETQYIDKVVSENPDSIAFITCHNYQDGGIFGDTVMWASSATYHMCNLVYRLVDKMSKAWIAKYGTPLKQAIDAAKHDVAATDYRLGCATMSTSAGTEQANATKYGILATNLEISDNWVVFTDQAYSSEAMTHGAETYANFIRTILRAYDHNDRKEYAPTPAYTVE